VGAFQIGALNAAVCAQWAVCAGTGTTPKQPSLLLSEGPPSLALALDRKFCIKGSGKRFQQACCSLPESAIWEASETAVQSILR